MTSPSKLTDSYSPWPFRVSLLLVCATFPLIWVGGLVTTYDAGMAVPDWPSTYGYNLFLYPWQSWLASPFDLFIEHGHRLLGSLAGILAIALVIAVYCCDRRVWFRRLAVAALALVVFQGLLGGLRVVLDERLIAMAHGCVGPLFFAMAAAMCVVSTRRWVEAKSSKLSVADTSVPRLAVVTAALTYVQLVVGAGLRHLPASASPDVFRLLVIFHLVIAAVVTLHVGLVGWKVLAARQFPTVLKTPAAILAALMILQLILGGGTWVVNYSWPSWAVDFAPTQWYTTIEAKGLLQSLTVTAHVANGSLILSMAVVLSLYSCRLLPSGSLAEEASSSMTTMKGVLA